MKILPEGPFPQGGGSSHNQRTPEGLPVADPLFPGDDEVPRQFCSGFVALHIVRL